MTIPRRTQVSLEATPYYHCIARCVRRAFLCGEDSYSGVNFDHRRQWLTDRIKLISDIFAIDICAYAIMSNHYHVVLRVDRDRAQSWSEAEVIHRWTRIFKGPLIVQQYLAGDTLGSASRETVSDVAKVWRERLHDIGWLMRCINEFIARRANKEDECKGHFWEGRFTSQALLDHTALLSCMTYVDLNPVRAGIASNLEDSDFTSIQERLEAVCSARQLATSTRDCPLLPLSHSQPSDQSIRALPFRLLDYIELVDWTGRMVRPDKSGRIPIDAPAALKTLDFNQAQWLGLAVDIQERSLLAIGSMSNINRYNESCGKSWCCGQATLRKLYRTG